MSGAGKPEINPDRKKSNMSLATVLMMIGLLLSKLTGQLREILVVPVFGGNTGLSDAFFLGFQIPDLFYQLLVGGAIQAAITPTLAAAVEKRKEKDGWRGVSIFINLTAVAVLLAVLIGELLSPVLIPLYNSNKSPAVLDLAVQVSRALFPQVFFMMLAALCIGVLNAYKRFRATAFGPAFYNICVILAMLLLGQATASGPVRVAAGVLLASCAYFVLQFYLARREFQNYSLSFDYRDQDFRQLLKLAVPTLISSSIIQVNMIILTGFASGSGAVTALRNASTTWQLPYGIFAVAIGNVMLPSLAGLHAVGDHRGSRRLLTRSLRSALFMIVPSAALFFAMRQDVIRAIFQWSADYREEMIASAAGILGWYCAAMVGQTIVFIINQAFYARRITKITLINGLLTLVLNSLLCLLFNYLDPGNLANLSLSYTITSVISVVFMSVLYSRGLPAAAPRRLWPFAVRLVICAAALLTVVMLLGIVPFNPAGKIMQLIWLLLRSIVGFVTFMLVANWLKIAEVEQIKVKTRNLVKKVVGKHKN
ncbi:MAG: murein biosynthesis integral membrane protein MurJ [Clostridiaceae bacterium]|nr:murein biosynthesis integral membrane protein MurJ [Clostridiaceae bacterium]